MIADTLANLPAHLKERARVVSNGDATHGTFVLYWMSSAMRVDENPALDSAALIAQHHNLPLLVYQCLSSNGQSNGQYASDRHHLFVMQGARDVQASLIEKGISYAFELETRSTDETHLTSLAQQARVVITEDMPVGPNQGYFNDLPEHTSAALICIDTACVVPMQLVGQAYTRAFQYRDATKALYESRLTNSWPAIAELDNNTVSAFDLSTLPFEPIDLQNAHLPELVSQCEIDHAIGPVVDTVGGSTAGYDRWNRFKDTGLARYAKQRNNPLVDGVSRMSAYLHHGMVSPMRLAREAARINNGGSQKYLDELLIWRELAYAFCFYTDITDPWSAIPDWAQQTLQAHAEDTRDHTYQWEELARAQTNDALWNAAQLSLLRQGELHNNVRMTWGKAILNWTSSPKRALELMIDLNHRYALDGCDPASYGGLLWCVGQFDRPFEPARHILGTVRPRSTTDHARRLDTQRYTKLTATPRYSHIPSVAVIGAGISGLMAARTLADHGLQITVFDKGRGVGGRMSTRRDGDLSSFDHGAQYFTARDTRFRRYVESWLEQDIVSRWPDHRLNQTVMVFNNGVQTEKPSTVERFVGIPAMNSVCKHLASDLNVITKSRITRIEPTQLKPNANAIKLYTEQGLLGQFDAVVVTIPAEQAAELLTGFPTLASSASSVSMKPCWTAMASYTEKLCRNSAEPTSAGSTSPEDESSNNPALVNLSSENWVGAFVEHPILSWAARNSTKPKRPDTTEQIVLQASHDWTAANWERDPDEVAQQLQAAFFDSSGFATREPNSLKAHRWKYAIPINPPENRCFKDPVYHVVTCGDWASGPRVEGAFLSGMAAAGQILTSLIAKPESISDQMMLDLQSSL